MLRSNANQLINFPDVILNSTNKVLFNFRSKERKVRDETDIGSGYDGYLEGLYDQSITEDCRSIAVNY